MVRWMCGVIRINKIRNNKSWCGIDKAGIQIK